MWYPETLDERLALSRECLAAAEEWGDDDARALALTALAGTLLEQGDFQGYQELSAPAWGLARSRRLSYVQVALGLVDLCTAAMADDQDGIDRSVEDLRRLRTWVEIPGQEAHEAGTMLLDGFWNLEPPEPFVQMLLVLALLAEGEIVLSTTVQLLVRMGRLDEARHVLDSTGWDGPQEAMWFTCGDAAALAEVGVLLDLPRHAARARELLAPMSGRLTVEGISTNFGPVDGYLALTEAYLGDTVRATALADGAAAYADDKGWGRYVRWLEGHRTRLGF
jgi:hypothetical protein